MKPETSALIYRFYVSFYTYCEHSMVEPTVDKINEMWHDKISTLTNSYIENNGPWKTPRDMIEYHISFYDLLTEVYKKKWVGKHINVDEANKRPGGRYLP